MSLQFVGCVIVFSAVFLPPNDKKNNNSTLQSVVETTRERFTERWKRRTSEKRKKIWRKKRKSSGCVILLGTGGGAGRCVCVCLCMLNGRQLMENANGGITKEPRCRLLGFGTVERLGKEKDEKREEPKLNGVGRAWLVSSHRSRRRSVEQPGGCCSKARGRGRVKE